MKRITVLALAVCFQLWPQFPLLGPSPTAADIIKKICANPDRALAQTCAENPEVCDHPEVRDNLPFFRSQNGTLCIRLSCECLKFDSENFGGLLGRCRKLFVRDAVFPAPASSSRDYVKWKQRLNEHTQSDRTNCMACKVLGRSKYESLVGRACVAD